MNTYETLMKQKKLGKITKEAAQYLLRMVETRMTGYEAHSTSHAATHTFLQSELSVLLRLKEYLQEYLLES